MVAVVSGTGLGLFGSSVSALGGIGATGSGAVGRGNDRVYVNTANGNLIIQSQDEHLSLVGADLKLVRTYNSQGLMDDDNGDNWRLGVHQRLYNLSHFVNQPGSTITKEFGDGRTVVYSYDAALSCYVSTEGDGAHDTLTNNGSVWTWTDGSTRHSEIYNNAYQLISSSDADGNTVTYEYENSRLARIRDAANQVTHLEYQGINLREIRVESNGVTQTLTRYTYDSDDRLTQVRVDLSPADNAVTDGNVFTTTYTYEGASQRVASVTQGDGSTIVFTYELIEGEFRVKSYSENGGTHVSLTANNAALTTYENTTVTTPRARTAAATPPGWTELMSFESQSSSMHTPQLGFGANGNGFAIFHRSTTGGQYEIWARQYNAATDSWSPEFSIEGIASSLRSKLTVDSAGNALVVWEHRPGAGSINTVYARRYDSATGAWGPQQVLRSADSSMGSGPFVSMTNGNAVVAWITATDGSTPIGGVSTHIYVTRLFNGTWSTAERMTLPTASSRPESLDLAIDHLGNVTLATDVIDYQPEPDVSQALVRRFSSGTQSWSAWTVLDQANDDQAVAGMNVSHLFQQMQVEVDAAGNAYVTWERQLFGPGSSLHVRRYDHASNTWQPPTQLVASGLTSQSRSLVTDAAGNVMLTWWGLGYDSNQFYSHFNAVTQTWSAAQNLTGYVPNWQTIVSRDPSGTGFSLLYAGGASQPWYKARFQSGAWQTAVALSGVPPLNTSPNQNVAVLPDGSIAALFSYPELSIARYYPTASYVIPAGATWASIAFTLYGTEAAAGVLQSALGNPPLTAGARLRNLPASLNVTSTVSVPVTPYYTVVAGDTWTSIAQTVYGNSSVAAAQALENAMAGAALVPGTRLIVPLNLSFAAAVAGSRTTMLTYSLPGGGTGTQSWNANAAVLSTEDTQTQSNNFGVNPAGLSTTHTSTSTQGYSIDSDALTMVPGGGWSAAELLETGLGIARSPQLMFDGAGNALAVWTYDSDTVVRRYTVATGTWGPPLTLDASSQYAVAPKLAIDQASGDAIVAWVQSDGVAESIYARLYDASSDTWSAVQLLESGSGRVSGTTEDFSVAIAGQHAAVSWMQNDGAADSIYMAHCNNGVWASAVLLESNDNRTMQAQVAIDSQGNVTTVWRQWDGLENRIYFNRWSAASSSFTGAVALDTYSDGDRFPEIAFDAQGNGFVLWGGGIWVRRFDAATGAWGPALSLDTTGENTGGWDLAVDAAGNAIVGWVRGFGEDSAVYACRYDAATGTWGTSLLLETEPGSVASNIAVAIRGDYAAVTWVHTDGVTDDVYAVRYANGAWGTRQLLDSRQERGQFPVATIDAFGNTFVAWVQPDGWSRSIYQAQYTSTGSTPYLMVPSGATWQSIANTLYGVNSAAAGAALQAALGNPTLTAGAQLGNLPQTLSVTTTTTTSVPPYYPVPANATWRSIANALYGIDSVAAGSALQTALGDPSLSAGAHLTGLPGILTVTTTVTVVVPPYYTVQAGDSWESITQAIYGTSDAQAVNALSTLLGGPALSSGLRLTVPATLTSSNGGRTDVVDALGRVTTYLKDAAGRLTGVLSPAVDGIRVETRYTYDGAGNVISIIEDVNGLNRVTTMSYDARGNLLLSRDSLGHTVERAYDSDNRLLSQSRYLVNDPDGAGPQSAAQPLATHYIHDGNQLRFLITAEGGVTEYRYFGNGLRQTTLNYLGARYDLTQFTLSDLVDWAAGQPLDQLQRTDYDYDFRGNVTSTTQWLATDTTGAGTGTPAITSFVYDQRGRLLQKIDPLGTQTQETGDHLTSYTYDGLGRQLSATQWVSADVTHSTLTAYDDAGNRVITTVNNAANTRVTTSTYNRAGELTSIVESAAGQSAETTTYSYDAGGQLRMVASPSGSRQFYFHDAAGHRIASVDADGSLIEHVYNAAGEVVKTIQYAEALDATTFASLVDSGGLPADVSLQTLRAAADGSPAADRITRKVYDAAGLLTFEIDEAGGVARYFYDGAGRLIQQLEFANPSVIARSVNELRPADVTVSLDPPNDRRVRYFYDSDDRLRGTLDGAGYLAVNEYDAAGRLTLRTAYANHAATSLWLAGDFDALWQSVTEDPEHDQITRYFYDRQGRRAGELDAEGYLTHWVYDASGRVTQRTRFADDATYAPGNDLDDLLGQMTSTSRFQRVTFQYDGAGQVREEVSSAGSLVASSSITKRYSYDAAGNLLSTTTAAGTGEARTARVRYDFLGRVIQELTSEGSAQLAGVTDPALIASIWSRYGVTYVYDGAGRRISATVRPDDTQTNTTRYFYDTEGRIRFEVNVLGERREYRYNALGQVTQEIRYNNRISTVGLVGGALTSSLTTQLQANADSARDSVTAYAYSVIGRIQSSVTAEGATTTLAYNAFGEQRQQTQLMGTSQAMTATYVYDRRGLLTHTLQAYDGRNIDIANQYDAFGRLTHVTDGRSHTSRIEYDRLGRQTATIDALEGHRVMTYDAFSRTLSVSDPVSLQHQTSYTYDDVLRTMTVVTPENVSVTTSYNLHGQTVRVTAAGNITDYEYDDNGRLIGVSDSLGALESREYDRQGRVVEQTDANENLTTFTYDAANRVLTKMSTAEGAVLTTTYLYDGQGRVRDVTEPDGRLTRTTYDRDGRVREVAVDPFGLNLRTVYTYDRVNNVLSVTTGYGSDNPGVVSYQYDELGRRVRETVVLGLGQADAITEYRYDDTGNLTRKFDARGYSTWYVYDDNNRLTHTIDATGGVTKTVYDAAGRIVSTRRYVDTAIVSGWTNLNAVTTANFSVTASGLDAFTQRIYDRGGRVMYEINAVDAQRALVTERTFDAMGNVTRVHSYVNAVPNQIYGSELAIETALVGAGNTPGVIGAAARVSWTAYDVRGQLRFTQDASGSVTQYEYDDNGNVTVKRQFATPRSASLDTTLGAFQIWATANSGHAQNRVTRYWYDQLDRLRFTLDAERYLTEVSYDDANRQRTNVVYSEVVTIPATATLQQIVARSNGVIVASGSDQETTTQFDVAGRVASIEDALGYIEFYGYDAVGNKLWFTNKKGSAAQDVNHTWRYQYDANSRLIKETTPAVAVTTVTADSNGLHATGATNVAIETVMTYDALGNVRTRSEAANTLQARTTTYEYDALGRQTVTRYPAAEVYDYSNDTVTLDSSLYSEVGYDALGNAIYGRDVAGNYSHKGYDAAGRVTWEVDAQRYLTFNLYDAFGNMTETRRFAAPVDASVGSPNRPSIGYPSSPAVGANDRVLKREYDHLNRLSKVTEPGGYVFDSSVSASGQPGEAIPQTVYKYNAFGQLVRESRLVHGIGLGENPPGPDASPSLWANSYYYYDRRGLKIAEVDAERYLTHYQYDESGDLESKTEYASRLSTVSVDTLPGTPYPTQTSGSNRYTRYFYDELNRLTAQRLDINYWDYSDPFQDAWRTGTTEVEYDYDALGNTICVTVNDAATYSYYDVLGRVIAIAEPRRTIGHEQEYGPQQPPLALTPFTQMYRDAFGNVVKQIEYAGDIGVVNPVPPPVSAALASDSHNRVTLNRYDRHGRLVETGSAAQVEGQAVDFNNANHAVRHVAYTKRGEVAKQWQTIQTVNPDLTPGAPAHISETIATTQHYDALGRQTRIVEPQAAGRVRDAWTDYNAFGEVTERRTMNANGVGVFGRETFEYDRNGRLWRTNADTGVYRVYLYDLAGHATAEIKSRDVDLSTRANLQAVLDLPAANLMRSDSVYDLLGRMVEQRGPSFELLDSAWAVTGTAATNVFQTVDRWGNVTRVVDELGRTTDYAYDQRNNLIRTILPEVEVLNTFGALDDPALGLPRARPVAVNHYDRNGNLIGKSIAEARGTDPFLVLGGNLAETAIYNQVGQVIKEVKPPLAFVDAERLYTLDRWGQRIQSVDELGYRARYQYDQFGNLTGLARERGAGEFDSSLLWMPWQFPTVQRPTSGGGPKFGFELVSYAYDQAGRRISETTGEFMGESGNAQETIRYWYDLFGNLIRKREPLGEVTLPTSDPFVTAVIRYETTYEYDINGKKTREVDGNGSWMTWSYDYFGQLKQHQQLTNSNSWVASNGYGSTGDTITYTHNYAGLLEYQSSAFGQRIDYVYDGAGHLRRVLDDGLQYGSGQGIRYSINRDTDYRYNALGERVGERTVIDGLTHQNASIVFDELGRLKSVTDLRSTIQYFYDARGNRTRVLSSFLDETSATRSRDDWYVYDSMNRLIINQGVFWQYQGIKEVRINETQGVELTYDARGDRVTSKSYGKRLVRATYFDEWFFTHTSYHEENGLEEHLYFYDGLSRVITDWRAMDTVDEFGTRVIGTVDDFFSPGIPADERYYDHAGRQTYQTTRSLGANGALDQRNTSSYYDDNGRSLRQATGLNGLMESDIYYGTAYYDPGYYWPGDEMGSPGSYTPAGWRPGYDAAGVLRGYRVYAYPSGRAAYFTNHSFEYVLGDSYQEVAHTAESFSTNGRPAPKPGSNKRLYNINGELVSYFDPADTAGGNNRIFATNAGGQVLTAIAISSPYSAYNYLHFGTVLDHTAGTPYAMPLAQLYRYAGGQYLGTFGELQTGSFAANFNTAFEPISSHYPAPVPAQVTIQAGDTLRSIAARVFGDGALWYVLADANGLTIGPDESLAEKVGWSLRVPNEVVSMTNNAGTFKPFTAADALGDTTPIQPAPPPPKSGKGCGVIGQILVIVVAIVATVMTAGALAGAAGSGLGTMFAAGASVMSGGMAIGGVAAVGSAGAFFATAAIAGAVGSAISQGVAIAIGQQDSFSWAGVAMSAVGAGLGSAMGASSFLSGSSLSPTQAMMVSAATSNALTQGVGILVGAQDKFNWRNVAVSAVAAPIAQEAARFVPTSLGNFGQQFAGGIAGSYVRRAFGGKIDTATILADAFGNALGNSIVDRMQPTPKLDFEALNRELAVLSEAEFDKVLRQDLRQQSLQVSLDRELARSFSELTEIVPDVPMPTAPLVEESMDSGVSRASQSARVVDQLDYTMRGSLPLAPPGNYERGTYLAGFGSIPTYSGELPSPFPLMRSEPRPGEWQTHWELPSASDIHATVRAAAEYHGIPAELQAAVLGNENKPGTSLDRGFLQFGERTLQSEFAAYETLTSEGAFGAYGNASSGIANMKPATLRGAASYVELELGYPAVPANVMPNSLEGTRFERVPGRDWEADLYFQAAHLREIVDRVSGVPNFAGPIDRDMVLDIGRHYNGGAFWNGNRVKAANATNYGRDVVRRLDNAASGAQPLYFYGQPAKANGGG